MTIPYQPTQPVFQVPPKKPSKHRGWKVVGVIVAAAVLFGLGTATHPTPAVQTVTVAGPTVAGPTVTATAKASAPAACVQALDEADKIVVMFQDMMTIFVDTVNAAAVYDTKTLNAQTPKITAIGDRVKANNYSTYSALCRAAK